MGKKKAMRIILCLAFTTAVCSGTYHSMPGGFDYHESCIHRMDDGASISEHELSLPCQYRPRPSSSSGKRSGSTSGQRPGNSSVGYYSDWAAYAVSAHTQGWGGMTSEWEVPSAPVSRGPAPPLISSSIY